MYKEQIFATIENEPDAELNYSRGYCYSIRRHSQMLHYCGYVYIPKDHPLIKKIESKDILEIDTYVSMHGGCTYHSEIDGYLIIGFDCGHAGDITPSMLKYTEFQYSHDVYRDYTYVKEQIYSIIEQLILMNTERLQKKYEKNVEKEYAKLWLLF